MTTRQAANFIVRIRRAVLDKIVSTKCMRNGVPSAEYFERYMRANHMALLRVVNSSEYSAGNYNELFKLLNK